ncbi:iron permease FTR1/Fip1/EfeU [Chlamydoabsidia padenii]|nr:iron permease FTR1/Fip1/EfeU [Chlamydoabsidia padenii]
MAESDLFSVPIFFILFRETCEASIIVAILLSFLKMTLGDSTPLYRRLRNQVWIGAGAGLGICLCIGAAFIAVWYTVLTNLWGDAELIWEGVFSLIATIMITAMGLAFLKAEKLQDKWKIKLAKAMETGRQQQDMKRRKRLTQWMQKNSFFILPFVTILREGLEAVVFIGGVSLNVGGKSIPIAAIMGFLCGCLVGYIIYRGGSMLHLRWFFIFSTVILYLVAAGLMSKAVGFFEQYEWNKVIGGEAAEEGGDVIAYKVTTAVWHVSWGNPELNTSDNGGWMIFNAILGWNNTATIGSIISYCLYWILVAIYLVYLYFKQQHQAIAKAQRGEFYDEDADAVLDKAKQYVNEEGVILGNDNKEDDGQVDGMDERIMAVDFHK